MVKLTVQQVAELKGVSDSAVRHMIRSGKLKAEKAKDDKNKDINLIAFEDLPQELQEKYCHRNGDKSVNKKPLDNYSANEREEISKWISILMQWQEYRNKQKSKVDADKDFVAGMKLQGLHLSVGILYRKWKYYKADDLDGLLDNRGKHRKGKTKIDDEVWKVFCSFYLDENRHSMMKCHEYTIMWLKEHAPEKVADVPDYTTFTRHVKDLPIAVRTLGRDGEKAFHDNCAPYIKREYDGMRSNEYWIADNHTFDVITQDANGTQHRLYLTAFFDARSGIFTGCYVTNAPSSQATLIALRNGILKYGIPENIYVDNGREFLTYDVGGLGHRQKKSTKDRYDPPPVFERLGIKMTNAIVRNARAKIIERRFRDVKDGLSKLFNTYTGGTVCERPEKLKHELKKKDIVYDDDFVQKVNNLLEGYFNYHKYNGDIASDNGKRRIDIFNEQLVNKRIACEADLNLMLMRSTRAQKVTRRGVHIKIAGKVLEYWNQDLIVNMLDQQVYLRYDPEDLQKVRVYDLDDRYIMDVPIDNDTILKYGADVEKIKKAMSIIRQTEKAEKRLKNDYIHPSINKHTALELVLLQAEMNKQTDVASKPEDMDITVQSANEAPLLHAIEGMDIDRMLENSIKNKERGGIENV